MRENAKMFFRVLIVVKLKCFRVSLLFSMFAFFTPVFVSAQQNIDFWKMKGDLKEYYFKSNIDSSACEKIIELTNSDGLPLWYAYAVHSIVCVTGKCRPLNVWLFWNGVGGYLGFQLYKKEPLTKRDHVMFVESDYEKLHYILGDTGSVLKSIASEEMLTTADSTNDKVDGYTGATRVSLQQYLVEGAAYTCYVLWHTVYGPVQTQIAQIVDEKANLAFLAKLLSQKETYYKIWAIDFMQKKGIYQDVFTEQVIRQIKSVDENLSLKALNFFKPEKLADAGLQVKLASQFELFPDNRQYELLWKLKRVPHITDEAIDIFLQKFIQEKMRTSLLGYVYDLIQPGNLNNQQISKELEKLQLHHNLYVRSKTTQLLETLKEK